jgi:hypothetical protein
MTYSHADHRGSHGIDDVTKVDETFAKNNGLTRFVNPWNGLAISAPACWQDNCSPDYFQVIDPETDTQFTGTVYDSSGEPNNFAWTKMRYTVVVERMPYLMFSGYFQNIETSRWDGMLAEYEGVFPSGEVVRKYVVFTFIKNNKCVSFSITADKEIYEKNKKLYLDIVGGTLDLLPGMAIKA